MSPEPETHLFRPSEIGWLQEARERAAPLQRRAAKLEEQAGEITSKVFAEVVRGYKKRLRGKRWEPVLDPSGVPIGYKILGEANPVPPVPGPPLPPKPPATPADKLLAANGGGGEFELPQEDHCPTAPVPLPPITAAQERMVLTKEAKPC